MGESGRLVASGRDSDIFDHGPGLVLRRARDGRSLAAEARTMDYVRSCGYPVPAIESVSDDGTEIVMSRIDGPSMVESMSRRPWSLRRHGRVLADLHRRLHDLPAPPWLAPAPMGGGADGRVVHLDLHPLNVMMSGRGPVVIDWANARAGDGAVDVALAWVLVASGELPFGRVKAAVMGRGRAMFLGGFLSALPPDVVAAARRVLDDVVTWKVRDPHMSDAECRRMRAVARAEGHRGA
ncbi:MAG TPA: phosphotransferase [Acidimicrobiales bacterium]|jgi:aminoglycoside phosphotransferase (APT) family kinase protein|nr:phosphotransferase [Acidimicrobiales bacterium]